MTEEIKEILDLLKYCVEKNEYLEVANMKEWKPLLNYITNLQKENRINNDLIPCFKNREKKLKKQINVLQKEKDDYKQRNEKAVEYIEKYLHEHIIDDLPDEESKFELENGTPIPNAKEVLLNILQGGDE